MTRTFPLLLALAACATEHPVPPVAPLPMDTAFAWPSVVSQSLAADGRTDHRRVAAARGALDIALAGIAQADPGRLPPRDRLAFHINAYNTLSIAAVLRNGIPDQLGPVGRADQFQLTRFSIGGRVMSLAAYQQDVIAPLARQMGEWRVPFALACPAAACPGLAPEPYAGPALDRQLEAATRRFLSDPANVRIDPVARTAYVSALVTPSPAVIPALNRYGATPVPEDYRVQALPFDWTVPAPD